MRIAIVNDMPLAVEPFAPANLVDVSPQHNRTQRTHQEAGGLIPFTGKILAHKP